MQFITSVLATASLAAAIALPAGQPLQYTPAKKQADLCPGLPGTPQCCQLSVLGVATVTCSDPAGDPNSVEEFQETCAAIGRTAECCVLPLLGLGLLCNEPQ